MTLQLRSKKIAIFLAFVLVYCGGFANDNLFQKARTLQRNGDYEEAIDAFKNYLLQPIDEKKFNQEQLIKYTDALMQLMNTYQSKGEPEACISTLRELYNSYFMWASCSPQSELRLSL